MLSHGRSMLASARRLALRRELLWVVIAKFAALILLWALFFRKPG